MTEPLHVACVIDSLGRGGTEHGVVNLVNRMDPSRFRFTLVLMRPDESLRPKIERDDVEVEIVERRSRKDLWFAVTLMRALRRIAPDIVHTRGFSCIEGIPAARMAGVKAVVHGEHGRDADEARRMKKRRARLRRVLFCLVDTVVTVSADLRASLLDRIPIDPTKIHVLPNGVDASRFDDLPDRTEARRRLGLPADVRVIGSVGRHDPVKAYGMLLQAAAGLNGAAGNAHVLLVGEGPQTAALRETAEALGIADRTTFAGFRDDVPDMLAAMDVFVLPSLMEGMSNALLEAMAAGLPCVATEVGGNSELITVEENGLLVPPSDPGALEDALARLLVDRDDAQRLGDAAAKRARAEFGLDAMVARYEALYEELAAEKGRSRASATRGDRRAAAPAP